MATINFSEVTEGTLEGSGVFDTLMAAIEVHLEKEYKDGRLKGNEYATVYLGAMQNAMQQAIQFVLTKQQADKQAELLVAQKLATEADTAIKQTQSSQDMLVKQQQISESVARVTREDELADENVLLLKSQTAKTDADKLLIDQKKTSELYQIIDIGTGVIGKQQSLYTNQANSFTRKAEVEATKLIADVYSMVISQDLDSVKLPTVFGLTTADNDLKDSSSVFKKALEACVTKSGISID
jgi:hypothetical protein